MSKLPPHLPCTDSCLDDTHLSCIRIAFFGEDAFSCEILKSLLNVGYEVLLTVIPYYENNKHKRLEAICRAQGIDVLRVTDINGEDVYNRLRQVAPDLCVVAHFQKLIKRKLLDIPPLGFINVHPSLLPNYRGMSPQHYPIINGEKEAGITVHYIDDGTDTGDIIVQRCFPLTEDMYVSDLQKIWLKEYKTIALEAINNILKGRKTVRQSHIKGSYYGVIKPEHCKIHK